VSGADNADKPFKRFAELAQKLSTVPKDEIDQQRAKKPKRPRTSPRSA
jgi:hypothetical protein